MKNIIENAKEIAGLIKKYNDQELYEKIVDLREQILELRNDNITSIKHIHELEESNNIRDNLKWDPPYYWLQKDGIREGPFCQLCWDRDEKLIRLQECRIGSWICFACQKSVYDNNYTPPQPEPSSLSTLDGW